MKDQAGSVVPESTQAAEVGGLRTAPTLDVMGAAHRLRRRPSAALDLEPLAARLGEVAGRHGLPEQSATDGQMEVRDGDST